VYKVPASFAHNAARCKVCKGVVHLSAPPGASAGEAGRGAPARLPAQAMPAKKVVPKPPQPRAPQPGAPPSRATPAARGAEHEGVPRSNANGVRPGTPTSSPRAAESEPPAAAEEPRTEPGRKQLAHPGKKPKAKLPMAGILSAAGLLVAAALLLLFKERLFGSSPTETVADPAAPADAKPAPAVAPEESSSATHEISQPPRAEETNALEPPLEPQDAGTQSD